MLTIVVESNLNSENRASAIWFFEVIHSELEDAEAAANNREDVEKRGACAYRSRHIAILSWEKIWCGVLVVNEK